MEIKKDLQGKKLVLNLSGRLDTTTSPALEEVIKNETSDITELVLDFSEIEYVSSAGLRVLLMAQKIMQKQGEMCVTNVNDVVMDVLEVTGFVDILTVK